MIFYAFSVCLIKIYKKYLYFQQLSKKQNQNPRKTHTKTMSFSQKALRPVKTAQKNQRFRQTACLKRWFSTFSLTGRSAFLKNSSDFVCFAFLFSAQPAGDRSGRSGGSGPPRSIAGKTIRRGLRCGDRREDPKTTKKQKRRVFRKRR